MARKTNKPPSLPLDLPDKELADAVRGLAAYLKQEGNSYAAGASYSAAILLASLAVDANAETLKMTLSHVTHKGKMVGDWEIVARKVLP